MEVTQIKLEGGLPSEVSVTMPIAEAIAIGKVFGAMNGHAHAKLGITSYEDGVYSALVGSVFNRFWDDGLEDLGQRIELETLNKG